MMLPRVFSMSILAVALLAGSASAQSADRPTVNVGDQWQFVRYFGMPSPQPNRAWVINAITPEGIEGTENGEPLRLTSDLGILESPLQKDSNPRALSFPLEVGKQWRYTTDWLFKPTGSKGNAVIEVKVIGHERIRVPAGEFEAFKLVAKATLSGISAKNSQIAGETETTYWYAPTARAVVKSVSRNPYIGITTVELVEFQLRP